MCPEWTEWVLAPQRGRLPKHLVRENLFDYSLSYVTLATSLATQPMVEVPHNLAFTFAGPLHHHTLTRAVVRYAEAIAAVGC